MQPGMVQRQKGTLRAHAILKVGMPSHAGSPDYCRSLSKAETQGAQGIKRDPKASFGISLGSTMIRQVKCKWFIEV